MEIVTDVITFTNARGAVLAAQFDRPASGALRSRAIVAHCFTCTKDYAIVRRTARALAARGVGVLRFDFEAVGESGGDFATTGFTTYVEDHAAAAAWLRETHGGGPELLVGHSLGGVVGIASAAAGNVPEVRALVTLASPAGPADTAALLLRQAPLLATEGAADVVIGGKRWRITRSMMDDFARHDLLAMLQTLRLPLLVMQSPDDAVVAPDAGSRLFAAAAGPRAYVSLDGMDHLFGRPSDAAWVASLIATWASRWVDLGPAPVERLPHASAPAGPADS